MTPRLRPYQIEGIERVRDEVRRLRAASLPQRVVLVLATGGGKTLVASEIVRSTVAKSGTALFCANRKELIDQTYSKLLDAGIPAAQLGVIMADDPRRNPVARVQIASVDTLRNRQKPPASLVVFDECHLSLSKTWRDLAEHYSSAVLLGLTATPYRGDGRGLGELFKGLVAIASPRELIGQGYLVEPTVFTVPSSMLPDLSAVKMSGGDYDEAQLQAVVDTGVLVGSIVEHWRRHAEGRQTVVFAAGVEHSRHIMERFAAAGICAEHLDGETPREKRDAILARLRDGATRVVSSCGVLTTGWDCPPVKCAVLARPTKSTGLYLQMAGRILRPHNNIPAIILDHAGNALEHGLPQDDREFSLDVAKRRGAANACPTRTCPECFRVLPGATAVCPCGHLFEREERGAPRETDGELVRVDAAARELEQLRRKVSSAVSRFCRAQLVEFSDANKAIYRRFRKRRAEQTAPELRAVLGWIESPDGLGAAIPRPAPAVTEKAPAIATDGPFAAISTDYEIAEASF